MNNVAWELEVVLWSQIHLCAWSCLLHILLCLWHYETNLYDHFIVCSLLDPRVGIMIDNSIDLSFVVIIIALPF
jgi:hypothetical protein